MAFDEVYQQPGSNFALLLNGLAHGSKRREGLLGNVDIVKADDA